MSATHPPSLLQVYTGRTPASAVPAVEFVPVEIWSAPNNRRPAGCFEREWGDAPGAGPAIRVRGGALRSHRSPRAGAAEAAVSVELTRRRDRGRYEGGK